MASQTSIPRTLSSGYLSLQADKEDNSCQCRWGNCLRLAGVVAVLAGTVLLTNPGEFLKKDMTPVSVVLIVGGMLVCFCGSAMKRNE